MQFFGISAHTGSAQGKVCIVHNPDEFKHCGQDSIVLLVGVKPNAALMKRCAGLLSVHGGITSHAAIAARENNKPAAVGLKEDILEYVHDGDIVEIDGERGVVHIKP